MAGAPPAAAVPTWLRRAVSNAQSREEQGVEDVAVAAGAAIGMLDTVVRRQERWAGAWQQRLTLAAAVVTVRAAGRIDDEAALRDAVLLTRPGDDAGPAGRMLLAWRRLAGTPAEKLLVKSSIASVLEELGHSCGDDMIGALAKELQQLAAGSGLVEMLAGASGAAERHGFGRAFAAWLADALLAQRLGWPYAVPLLGTEVAAWARGGRMLRAGLPMAAGGQGIGTKALLAAQARAALRAVDLSAELGRRAERLVSVAPKLRAKGSDAVVGQLLNEDALVASRSDQKAGMSDRGMRRLFDRLIELGAVRELSGRSTFRIYGL